MKPQNLTANDIAQLAGQDLETEFLTLARSDPEVLDFISTYCLDGIWYWDLEDPDRGWISPRFWEFLGYDPAMRAPRRSSWLDVLHPDDRAAAQRNYDKLIADPDHPFHQVLRYYRADGTIAWMQCRGMALRREEGRPTRMLGIHMDVTPLKLARHDLNAKTQALKGAASELMRREQELQFIFDHLPVRIWYQDEKNRILHVNEPARKFTEAGGTQPTRDESEQAVTCWMPMSDIAARTDPATGREKWVRIDKIPYFDKSLGRRTLLIVETDIPLHQERTLPDDRQKSERDLWRRHYAELYARMPAMTHCVGNDGRLIEVSDQWLERTGYRREDVVGRKAAEFVLQHPALGGQGVAHPLSRRGETVRTVPCRLLRKEGAPIAVELSAVTAMNPASGGAFELVMVTDVSERNMAFLEIARLSTMLEVLHARMDRSIQTAAARYREPLALIREASRRIAEDQSAALDGESLGLVGTISDAARQMTHLTEDLLSYSMVLNRPMQMGRVDLQGLIRSLVAELKPELDAVGARVLVGPCPVISVDRQMIEVLFRNLLANAIRFRDPERPLQVRIACMPHPGVAATFCTVRDNGIGFDPEAALSMFEPFARQHRGDPPDGAGLRLAICKAVCERHGWTVWAEPADENGSVYTIRIPDKRLVRRPLSRIAAGRRSPRGGPRR